MLHDLRYALRQLARRPGFAVVAIVTLALGIGANTAMFSLAAAALLQSPPVRAPDRLVAVYTACRRGAPRCSSSYPDYLDYRARSRTLADLTAYSWATASLGSDAGSQLVTIQMVTGNYFALLGVRPGIGRLLTPDDDRRGDARQVAVLSRELWQARFGGDSGVVGRTVRLDDAPFEVVGVAPAGFEGLHLGGGPDVYIPLLSSFALGTGFQDDAGRLDDRASRWIAQLVGRMAPGVTVAQVRADMLAISHALAEEDPQARGPRSITVDPMSGYILPANARTDLQHFVAVLVAVVGLALLLACANLANLLLGRSLARRREIGVRLALGARRSRLVRQLLTESVTLAVLGGGLGVLVGVWVLSMLAGFDLPGGATIGALHTGLDARMIAIAAGLSLLTGVAFGLLPAWQASGAGVVGTLRGEGADARGQAWTRRALVALQVAMSFVLVAGSGLFLRTLVNTLAFDPGFRPGHVALARFDLALHHYTPDDAEAFTRRLVTRIAQTPGVSAVGLGTAVPFQGGGFSGVFVAVTGYQPAPDEEMRVDYVLVGPGHFRALGIPIREGRDILATDDAATTPVAVVSEAAARRWWPHGDAVGGRLTIGGGERQVVGVVGDADWRQLGEEATPFVFLPLQQLPARAAAVPLVLTAGTRGDPSGVLRDIRREIAALDRDLSLSMLETMSDRLGATLMPQRMGALLLTLFALLALVLAAVGIYGVVSFNVNRERRSIGIRMALGAPRRGVLAMVGSRMVLPVGAGLAAGLGVAWLLARAVERFLFGVGSRDPVTYGLLALLIAAVAALATLIPARQAIQTDPMEALRYE